MTEGVIPVPVEDPVLGLELETLNPLQKETVKDVKVSTDPSETQQVDIWALLEECKDIFTDVPSVTNVIERVIQLTTFELIKGRAYLLPLSLQETFDCEIDNMMAMGLIEEFSAAYSSPVLMVNKPNERT